MKRILVIAIPIITLSVFVLVMISDNFLKYPLDADDNIPDYINTITKNITNKDWDAASENTQQLSHAWKKVVKRIQFSAETNEINSFNVNIARLSGAILAKDQSDALMELQEALEHWKNVGK